MEVRLEVTHRKANVNSVVLRGETLVGRSTECRLRIASSSVSRRHCLIAIERDRVSVRDLGSSNGTRVDGRMLTPHEDAPLHPGSLLEVGPVQFVVRFVSPGGRQRLPELHAGQPVTVEPRRGAGDEPVANKTSGVPEDLPDNDQDDDDAAPAPERVGPEIEAIQEPSPAANQPERRRSLFPFGWLKRKPRGESESSATAAPLPPDEHAGTEPLPVTESPGSDESDAPGLTEGAVVDLLMDSESDDEGCEEDTMSSRADDPELSDFLNQLDSKDE